MRLNVWKTKPMCCCRSLGALGGSGFVQRNAVDAHRARGWREHAAENGKKRRFAAAAGADDRDEFAGFNFERSGLDAHNGVAFLRVSFRNVVESNHG